MSTHSYYSDVKKAKMTRSCSPLNRDLILKERVRKESQKRLDCLWNNSSLSITRISGFVLTKEDNNLEKSDNDLTANRSDVEFEIKTDRLNIKNIIHEEVKEAIPSNYDEKVTEVENFNTFADESNSDINEKEYLQKINEENEDIEPLPNINEDSEKEHLQKFNEGNEEIENLQKISEENEEIENLQKISEENDETENLQKIKEENNENLQKINEENEENHKINKNILEEFRNIEEEINSKMSNDIAVDAEKASNNSFSETIVTESKQSNLSISKLRAIYDLSSNLGKSKSQNKDLLKRNSTNLILANGGSQSTYATPIKPLYRNSMFDPNAYSLFYKIANKNYTFDISKEELQKQKRDKTPMTSDSTSKLIPYKRQSVRDSAVVKQYIDKILTQNNGLEPRASVSDTMNFRRTSIGTFKPRYSMKK
jgi:hypothetical protein